MRAQIERKVASKEKDVKEKQLRKLAEEARNKRAGIKVEGRGNIKKTTIFLQRSFLSML